MHGHLKDVLRDYGPVYNFWLFSFERYNGILGNQPNNNRSIEPQLLQHFINNNQAYSFDFLKEFEDNFNTVGMRDIHLLGSVSDTIDVPEAVVELPSRCKPGVFDAQQLEFVLALYLKLNPEIGHAVPNSTYLQYHSLTICGKVYGSSEKRDTHSPFIAMAHWDEGIYGPPPTTLPNATHPDSRFRPIKVHYYVKANFSKYVGTECHAEEILLLYVSWYFPHENQEFIGKPAQVWCQDFFERPGPHSFIPVDLVVCHSAHCVREIIANESVLVIVPLVEYIMMAEHQVST